MRSAEPPMARLRVGRYALRRCVDSRGSASAVRTSSMLTVTVGADA